MDVLMVLDKTKVIDKTGFYKIIQIDEVETFFENIENNIISLEDFNNIFIFTNFEYLTINNLLPDDFICGSFVYTDLFFYRTAVSDFFYLSKCFSFEEVLDIFRNCFESKTFLSSFYFSFSFKNKLPFIDDCLKRINIDYFSLVEVDGLKLLNGAIYKNILNISNFIEDDKLLKEFFNWFYSYIQKNTDFDKYYIKVTDLKNPSNIAFCFIGKELATKIFNCLGYFYRKK